MTKEQLNYVCNTYGDPRLPDGEKWKSIIYISTTTTKMPTFSFQHFVRRDRAEYIEDGNEPGFIIIDNKSAHSEPMDNQDGLVKFFIPLSMITAISVWGKSIVVDD